MWWCRMPCSVGPPQPFCAQILTENVASGDLSDFVDSGISNLRVSISG